jgi:hypothetical protein
MTDKRYKTGNFVLYNLKWPQNIQRAALELAMIQRGGQWRKQNGELAGEGLAFHYRKFQEVVWPEKIWQNGPYKNYWAEQCLDAYLNHTYVGVIGCAASSKSDSFGSNALTDWYAFPDCTTVLVSSTDLPSLELRIWGMIKKYHKLAKAKYPWLPGSLIEGKRMLILDPKNEASEGRDFKNGIIGVACKRGNTYVGLSSYIGIHNQRVRLIGDELNLLPRAMLDSVSNLAKCQDFKFCGLGNPNETTNAHGVLCEPSAAKGGWECGIDQQPGTKTWETKFPNGICLQLPGSDSPNLKAPEGEDPPFPFLITREQLKNDAAIWGIDDWHYTMMDEARMPRGQGSRRVLTRQMCQKFGAFREPLWRDTRRTNITFLDAAYRGVGGDRCVFGELQFGYESQVGRVPVRPDGLVVQSDGTENLKDLLALIDLLIIPIDAASADSPEEQIVAFVKNQCINRAIPGERFFFDAGMRTSLVTAFSRIWTPMVNSIDCGGKPSEHNVSADIQTPCRDYYSKFITELWFNVRLIVESGQFRGMTEELCTEFSQREWKRVAGNKIEVETKEEMKVKSGRSPDLADAVAVGCFGAIQRGLIVKRSMASEGPKPGKDWRDAARAKAKELWKSGRLNYAA